MGIMFKKEGLTLSSMAELDIFVNLQIKLLGGATVVNWSLMSLFGFAVGSPFRPIGQQGKLIRQLSGTQRVNKTTRRSLRKIITTTHQLIPWTTMAMENFGLNPKLKKDISFSTKQYLSASAL